MSIAYDAGPQITWPHGDRLSLGVKMLPNALEPEAKASNMDAVIKAEHMAARKAAMNKN